MPSDMTFQERNAWIFGIATFLAYAAYLAVVLVRARGMALPQVAWVGPMVATIGGAIVASIAASIVGGMVWGRDGGGSDVRDREIHRLGEYVGYSVVSFGGAAALALTMAEAPHFWIGNAIYLSFALAVVLASIRKIHAYRSGFQP